jgi:hypothetical protein
MIFEIDAELKSVMNLREHWVVKLKRKQALSMLVKRELESCPFSFPLPVQVIITRISPRPLDIDNLVPACKSIKDDIADFLIPGKKRGRADDSKQIRWFYDQAKPAKGDTVKKRIKIEINSIKNYVEKC